MTILSLSPPGAHCVVEEVKLLKEAHHYMMLRIIYEAVCCGGTLQVKNTRVSDLHFFPIEPATTRHEHTTREIDGWRGKRGSFTAGYFRKGWGLLQRVN